MSRFIQPLEQRMFLSVSSSTLSSDLATIRTDGTAVHSTAGTLRSNVAAALKTVANDVRALRVKSNNKPLATLQGHFAVGYAKGNAAVSTFIATAEGESAVIAAEGKVLLAKPSNTRLAAKIATDSSNLNSKVAAKLSALQTADSGWQSQLDADLTGLASSNSSSTTLAADVAAAKAALSTGISNLDSAAATFQAAVTALTADATSIA